MTGERGSVSVVVAAVIVVVGVIAFGAADLTRVLETKAEAQSAADAAALAAAQELALSSGDRSPEELAAEYAARNGAQLVSCACDPDSSEAVVDVRMTVDGLVVVRGPRTLTARARAVVDHPEEDDSDQAG